MASDDLFKIMGVVVTLIIAWLGYQQVKSKNAGDAVYATAQSVVLLSSRVRELENEKADLSDRFERERTELNNRLEAEIKRLRGELDNARAVVSELRLTIQKGEAAMNDLQKQFDQDRIIRDEVVRSLTEKITMLESELNDYRECLGLTLGQLIDAGITPTRVPKGVIIPEPKRTNGGLIP